MNIKKSNNKVAKCLTNYEISVFCNISEPKGSEATDYRKNNIHIQYLYVIILHKFTQHITLAYKLPIPQKKFRKKTCHISSFVFAQTYSLIYL